MAETPTTENDALRRRIHRPAASATWEHIHHWGSQFGDSTSLHVTRIDDGPIRMSYGDKEFEVRADLVEVFARMVAAAVEWTDAPIPPGSDQPA